MLIIILWTTYWTGEKGIELSLFHFIMEKKYTEKTHERGKTAINVISLPPFFYNSIQIEKIAPSIPSKQLRENILYQFIILFFLSFPHLCPRVSWARRKCSGFEWFFPSPSLPLCVPTQGETPSYAEQIETRQRILRWNSQKSTRAIRIWEGKVRQLLAPTSSLQI